MLTNEKACAIYGRYVEAWKAMPAVARAEMINAVVAADVSYSTPQHESGGRETIINDIAAFQGKFPGGHFAIGDVSAHHDLALLTWVLVKADGNVFARGHDQIRVSADGKIIDLITFAPSVPTA